MKLIINSKKGFTLSIYVLIIIIVGLVTMLLAFGFFFQAMDSTKGIAKQLDAEQKMRIDKYLIENNDRVYVPVAEQKMYKKESRVFGMGIKNVLGEISEFTVFVSFLHAKDFSGNFVQVDDNVNRWVFQELGPYSLDDGEKQLVEIPFRVHETAKENLVYTYNIEVKCSLNTALCDPYGYPQAISIEVV